MNDPRANRKDKWELWFYHFPFRRNAPPKGWHKYLREAWCNDQWADAYRLYLQSTAWKQRRTGTIRRVGGKCQMCGNSGKLHVHHITYVRVGQERADDLRALCPSCHKLRHSVKRGAQPIPLDPLTRMKRERALAGLPNLSAAQLAQRGTRRPREAGADS